MSDKRARRVKRADAAGLSDMKEQLLHISRENEAGFPIEAKQLRAMWRAGYVTANARYWCKETFSWRTIAEFRLGVGMSPKNPESVNS